MFAVFAYIIVIVVLFVAILVTLNAFKRSVSAMQLSGVRTSSVVMRKELDLLNLFTLGVLKKTPASILFDLSSIGQTAVDSADSAQQYFSAVLNNDAAVAEASFGMLRQNITMLSSELHTTQNDLQQHPFLLSRLSESQKQQFARAISEVELAQEFITTLPQLTGPGEKRYIVLLQNNMELRPTGGFLGSYAYLTFNNGVMESMDVKDIYVPDGQLNGYVEPPAPIKKYLLQTGGWKLRDSNWDPNFPTAAPTIKWFFEHSGYTNIDGMISTNLSVMQHILTAIGPVFLPDYNVSVNADNFYSIVQVETEQSFFPGATNKSDILSALSRAVLRELHDLPAEKQTKLFSVLLSAAASRDLAVWFENPVLQQFAARHGWDGAISAIQCELENCVRDNLYIVEANVGINKTNCCLQRDVIYDVWIDEKGGINSTLSLAYQNNNPTTPQPPRYYGGGYEDYLRVYKNQESSLERITVDGLELAPNQITQYTWDELGVNESAFLSEVGGGEKRGYVYTFSDTQRLDLKKRGAYTLLLQRQPGILTNGYRVRVHYPPSLVTVSTKTPQDATIQQAGLLEISTTLDQSKNIQLSLEPTQ